MRHACILSSVHSALDNRVFYREARSLQRAGYRVTLIAVHPRDETKDGVQISGLPRVRRWRRPLLWARLVRRALRSHADVYHFHDPELLLVTPLLRLLTGRPTVYDVHESYPEFVRVKDYLPRWLRAPLAWAVRRAEPLLARLQSALVFSDDQIAAAFRGVRRPKAVLHNYPERSLVEQAKAASTAASRTEPVVLYLGGMERNRGAYLMVEAFASVLPRLPEARLLVVGHFEPANLEQQVREEAARRGIGQAVTLTGRVAFEQIGGFLARASVGWVPWQPVPKNEQNVPTKLFEYMAYGLPVVASDLVSTRAYLQDGQAGLLVPAQDAAAHAGAILELLEDRGRAAAMGLRGQQKVLQTYNWDRMEAQLLDLYASLLTRPPSTGSASRRPG